MDLVFASAHLYVEAPVTDAHMDMEQTFARESRVQVACAEDANCKGYAVLFDSTCYKLVYGDEAFQKDDVHIIVKAKIEGEIGVGCSVRRSNGEAIYPVVIISWVHY